MPSDTDPNISQLEALLLALPDPETPDLNPPNWPIPPNPRKDAPPPPSPFEDYQRYPFHWTGESLKDTPVQLLTVSSSPKVADRSVLIDQFPVVRTSQMNDSQSLKPVDPQKPSSRKRRFRQLRRAMSLTHIRHKPTPPDTAPPTPTVPTTIPSSSVGIKSLESLAHWQLPDPTIAPSPLDGNSIFWPPSLAPSHSTPHSPFLPPLDQLSPPSSIPSESDILPQDVRLSRGIAVSFSVSPSISPAPSPRSLYPPSLFDTIDLADANILEKDCNGKVLAGTAEGLVTYITSPECLDYEVLSDFFLMYRKFMEPSKLLYLLCARFEWGLIKGVIVKPPDNEGMVRVRTFAALRHWLLNYFPDDFAPSPSLRSQFVKTINAFGRDPRVRGSTRDTRIITELKRCWRRVCSVYWDERGRKSTFGGFEADISDAGQKSDGFSDDASQNRNRLPSLILRATRKREEMLGVGTSKSQPDLRRRFMESGRTGTINSTRPSIPRQHTRIHSASSIQSPADSRTRHRRNLSDETPIIYSKNSPPSVFHSFARGDGQQEWPPVSVRTDLLVASPTGTAPPQTRRRMRRFFRSRRNKLDTENVNLSAPEPKSAVSASFSCTGQLSDDEDQSSRRTIRNTIPFVSGRDRVDFLAAGMWPSFLTATSLDSHVNLQRAEELGEALVQGYIQPSRVDDESALEVAAALDKGKAVETIPIDDMTSSEDDQGNQTTLSMTEIERRLASTRPPSMPLPSTPSSFQRQRFSRLSQRFSIIPTPPPAVRPPDPPTRGLRRRPGGDLRQVQTVDQLHPRGTITSITSSMSGYSLDVIEDVSRVEIPSMSIESRSLRSLLDIRGSERKSRHSPIHRTSGMALDFSQFRAPSDIESSDDEDCDPIAAMEKTILKLEGKYVRKKRRPLRLSGHDSLNAPAEQQSSLDEINIEDPPRPSTSRYSEQSDSPPPGIMVERSPEDLWRRRHKHILDGQEIDTPTHHGPFVASSLFEFPTEDTEVMEQLAELQEQEVQDLYIQVPTLESAIAELERNQLEAQIPRIPSILPPRPPASYQRSLSSHLPFIMQFDSSVIARQFTLIEKDILAEIDWIELTEPTWMDRNPDLVDIRDWKGFVTRDEGENGIHTAIAHFNLMAGWTTSEVVLTQSSLERTLVISKFIHIAAACRFLRNFATLTQIVVGLQSQHVAGLTSTWEGLSAADMKLWQDLQELVDAGKNWAKMRKEMDAGTLGPRRKGEGCIPFLGIFMSDLVHVTSRSLSSGKVDFEGMRLRASIVKKTLRLIELSEEYDFEPVPGVGERCLWITAFDEPMLRRLAAGLEL